MIFPGKYSEFDRSILAKISYLLDEEVEAIDLFELLDNNQKTFDDVSEFVDALVVLFALGKVNLSQSGKEINYVD